MPPQDSHRRPRPFETLEPRLVLNSDLIISEFLARNDNGLTDEDGDTSDWIEIRNLGVQAANLSGHYLTDNSTDLQKWQLPSTEIEPGDFLVVFASNKNRGIPGLPLHTNFRLSGDGEYLALIEPDGLTITDEFSPQFPPQFDDVSYGVAEDLVSTVLLGAGTTGRLHVPSDDSLGSWWINTAFNDTGSEWSDVTTSVGYDESPPGPPPTVSSASLLLHLDAGQGVTKDSSNLVSHWDNLAGNDVSASGSRRPLWVDDVEISSNPLVRAPVIRFDGVDDVLSHLAFSSQTPNDITVFVVGTPRSHAGGWRAFFSFNDAPGLNDFSTGFHLDIGENASSSWETINFEGSKRISGFIDVKNDSDPFGTFRTMTVDFSDESGGVLYLDGVLEGMRDGLSGANINLDELRIGSRWFLGADHFGNVDIADLLVYDAQLSQQDREAVEAYLVSKHSNHAELQVTTDVSTQLHNQNSTAYLRLLFDVTELSTVDRLTLRAQYDDGFTAYLNGTEVARRNAPSLPTWDSVATAERPDNLMTSWEEIDISAHIGELTVGTNVLAVHGLNLNASDEDFWILPEILASDVLGSEEGYLDSPTPGASNTEAFAGFVTPVDFSVEHGFFDTAFDLALSTVITGADIFYTLDGSQPTTSNGMQYVNPIPIGGTSTLRAAAFLPGFRDSEVITNTYVFVADVILQSNMNPGIVNHPSYAPTIQNDLKAVPTISLVIDNADMFGPHGIHTNFEGRGIEWERPVSIELIDPNGQEGFQVNAGIRIHGQAGRGDPQKAFRIFFKDIYGPGKLESPLFEGSPVNRFDQLVLRSEHNFSWQQQSDPAGLVHRDQFSRDSQLAMGQPASHGVFHHLYINGKYWGIYNTTERPDHSFAAEHFGGTKDDYDAIKAGGGATVEIAAGDRVAWDTALSMAQAGLADATDYQAIQHYVDLENLIDFMLVVFYEGERDSPVCVCDGELPRNFYAVRRHNVPQGDRSPGSQFTFYAWDFEFSLHSVTENQTFNHGADNPAVIFQAALANEEFRSLFADRVQKHFFDGGALTAEANTARFEARRNELFDAIVAHSARWGSTSLHRDAQWIDEQNRIINTYFPQRRDILLNQFRARGWLPEVEPPALSQHGGTVPSGFNVGITAPVGAIYYTLDGSDPRLPGGAISPDSVLFAPVADLARAGDPASTHIPTSDVLGTTWLAHDFDDNHPAWIDGPTGVGFSTATTPVPQVSSGSLRLHLDAALGITTDAGGLVSAWADQSGHGNDLLASGSSRPQLVTGVDINGDGTNVGAVIRFDGVDDVLLKTNFDADGSGGISVNDLTLFIVTAPHSNAVNTDGLFFNAFFSGVSDSGNNHHDWVEGITVDMQDVGTSDFQNVNFEGARWGSTSDQKTSVHPFGTFHILSVDEGDLYVDGVLEGSHPQFQSGTINLGDVRVGARYFDNDGSSNISPGETGYLDGDMVEVLLYDGNLSNMDRQAIDDYLRSKYLDPQQTPPFATDIEAEMHNVNSTAYIRVPFENTSNFSYDTLTLRMKYEDGFVAHLNGTEVARRNGPLNPVWNSAAATDRPGSDSSAFETIDITAQRSALRNGTNVLAIQGMNDSPANDNFLIEPELIATGIAPDIRLYQDTVMSARTLDNDQWSALTQAVFEISLTGSPGDTDLDGDVDIVDFNTVAVHYDPWGLNPGNHWAQGNFDGDDDVDITDVTTVLRHFAPIRSPLFGDTGLEGDVDSVDFNTVAVHFDSVGLNPENVWDQDNFDGDDAIGGLQADNNFQQNAGHNVRSNLSRASHQTHESVAGFEPSPDRRRHHPGSYLEVVDDIFGNIAERVSKPVD